MEDKQVFDSIRALLIEEEDLREKKRTLMKQVRARTTVKEWSRLEQSMQIKITRYPAEVSLSKLIKALT